MQQQQYQQHTTARTTDHKVPRLNYIIKWNKSEEHFLETEYVFLSQNPDGADGYVYLLPNIVRKLKFYDYSIWDNFVKK